MIDDEERRLRAELGRSKRVGCGLGIALGVPAILLFLLVVGVFFAKCALRDLLN